MATLIQTTELDRPVTFLYRLIHLNEADESAPALKKALVDQLKIDGIYDIVKTRLVGLITDGASSMVGKLSGFILCLSINRANLRESRLV